VPGIREIEREAATAAQKRLLDDDVEAYGQVLNTTRLYAHVPALLPPLLAPHGASPTAGSSTAWYRSHAYASPNQQPPILNGLERGRVAASGKWRRKARSCPRPEPATRDANGGPASATTST
jgi:hypothetical protein